MTSSLAYRMWANRKTLSCLSVGDHIISHLKNRKHLLISSATELHLPWHVKTNYLSTARLRVCEIADWWRMHLKERVHLVNRMMTENWTQSEGVSLFLPSAAAVVVPLSQALFPRAAPGLRDREQEVVMGHGSSRGWMCVIVSAWSRAVPKKERGKTIYKIYKNRWDK